MQGLRAKSWSPFAVGVGIGLLSWFCFATVGRGLGITTAFEYAAALGISGLLPEALGQNAYFREENPAIDWESMLVVGVFVGSALSSWRSRDRKHATVPGLWRRRFGHSVLLRMSAAFLGGAVMMFGARLARGCTSGHGITGALQLAVSSWIFITLAFVTAALAALLMFGRRAHLGGE